MSATWTIFAVLLPPLAAVFAAVVLRPRQPAPQLAIGLNALMPGSGLAALGRPTLESVLGVLFAQVSLILTGGTQDLWMFFPSMIVGGIWALVHTPLSPLIRSSANLDDGRRLVERVAKGIAIEQRPLGDEGNSSPLTATRRTDQEEDAETVIENHYSVEVRCTECGAAVPVPVLHHMAHCSFCGSDHLIVGHEETLLVTLPERVYDGNVLREALLDHYRAWWPHWPAMQPMRLRAALCSTGRSSTPPSKALRWWFQEKPTVTAPSSPRICTSARPRTS
jgi:hypothetical protein